MWVFFVIGRKKVAAQKNWIFGALHRLYYLDKHALHQANENVSKEMPHYELLFDFLGAGVLSKRRDILLILTIYLS